MLPSDKMDYRSIYSKYTYKNDIDADASPDIMIDYTYDDSSFGVSWGKI